MRPPIQKTISIGQLSNRTGVAISALRYYEEQGLLAPERNAGGQRRYLRADIRRVSFVLIAQKFGFSIQQIRQELDRLPKKRTPTKQDWAKISQHFGQVLEDRITTLQTLRARLDGCIGCGCLSLSSCHLYNPDDSAGQNGAGPRYLMGDQQKAP